MRWCCAGFEFWYTTSDERGLGIVVDRAPDGKPIFLLQYRAVDRGVSLPNTGDVLVTLLDRSAISHCPSCGRYLRSWYKKDIDELQNTESLDRLREELA